MVKPKPVTSPEKHADQSTQDESILNDWPSATPGEPAKQPTKERQTVQEKADEDLAASMAN